MTDQAFTVSLDPGTPQVRPLFAISPSLPESIEAQLKPVRIALDVAPSAFPARLGGFASPADSPYARRKGAFGCAVRGFGGTADRIWFFRGKRYLRYFEKPERRDETSDWLPIAGNWNLPPAFANRVDAVLTGGIPPFEGHVWLFSGDQYLRYDPNDDVVIIGAQPIEGNWGLPPEFCSDLDAAVHGVGPFLGIVWFFKGGRYVRYNLRDDVTEFGPADIGLKWNGWPDAFADGVDFAFYGTGPHENHLHFFRGDQFIRYDLDADRVVDGPVKATEGWPALGRFMPVPQLFLDERYKLFTFHGQLGNGGMVDNKKIEARSRTEVWIITRRQEQVDTKTSSNVLESNSQQVVDNFADQVRRDDAEQRSRDDYDYGTDASFHGEAEATGLTGGEVDADLHVRGQTHDVRSSFAKAVGRQIDRAKQESQERHTQQVRMEESDKSINQQTEIGFRQVVDNASSAESLNFVLFQLTQEYILVLSLVDAQLVFRNGDDRATVAAPIRDMRRLLDSVVEDPGVRADVARAVTAALTAVTDATTDTERSLLNAAGTAVDPKVRTTFQVTDTEGRPVRAIAVDGIVVGVDRPVVLTPNTAIAPIGVF
ncbi:hemopexin repeat-containing protein [Actinoplanes oblitus]|uniref:Hemopexin repeat-containing protein n=1 Tax=Actinoplanes oblitus TaxID=3040509 RepID=A0ABY8WMX8_9ACTN|nr:hemopexin repeat-containing protein [Actinoplanes oblitus]WIM97888.1 hemopexin repeat-containing protein [Actinoplanes oblitus]